MTQPPDGANDQNAILRFTLDLPEERGYVAGLRKTACCLLASAGVAQEDLDDIEVMIGELATNAVMHACAGSYHVEIEYFGDRVLVVVSDHGRGFPGMGVPEPGTPRPDPSTNGFTERYGGWGLPLVFSLADHVEILPRLPHGTTVRAEKRVGLASARKLAGFVAH